MSVVGRSMMRQGHNGENSSKSQSTGARNDQNKTLDEIGESCLGVLACLTILVFIQGIDGPVLSIR